MFLLALEILFSSSEYQGRPDKILGAEAQLLIRNVDLPEESSSWKLDGVEV